MAPQALASSGSGCGGDFNCLRLFYNSNRSGSSTYFWGSNVSDLASYTFLTSGTGKGLVVKNNAASALNDSPYPATVFYNSNYGGACDTLTAYAIADRLHNTYNNDASFKLNYSSSACYTFN
ncbi:peptidase inhibitor family I36 protein [Streptomyces mirabilis]